MHLREIEIENFKSFGRKCRIPLLPGYTAVTGPNGAGKSNISDAILFVLGPKSSRVIRAGRLPDLIYNGGKTGHPASECKVSLYFDNSDRLIPCESDTVKLTRIVRLSDSEDGYYSYYYLNDRKSSLGDIESLLAHARISADGYNFVQQGDITKITQMGAMDRRRILDDIAGISRFDEDIARAERERQEAEENITKLKIILDELKKQMRQLEADRQCAMKYRDMRDKLLISKAQLATRKKEEIERELVSIQEQIAGYEEDKGKLTEKIEKAKQNIVEFEEKMAAVDARIIKKGGDSAREVKEKIDQIRLDLARAEDSIETSEEQLQMLAEESKTTKAELKKIDRELGEIEQRKEEHSKAIQDKSEAIDKLRSNLSGMQNAMSESDAKLGTLQEESDGLVKELTGKEDVFRTLSIEQDKLSGKVERLRSEIAELEETKRTYEFELKDAEWTIKQLSSDRKTSESELKKLQKEFYEQRNEEKRLLTESQELEDAIKSLTREYNRLRAEADAEKMVAEGYTAAVGRIIEARDKGQIKGIHGTVSDICKVDKKHENAIIVAAGNRLQAVIVENDEIASKCIDLLKKQKLGRVTFLPLNKMIEGKPRGKAIMSAKKSQGFAIDLIEFEEKYRAALWYVVGDTIVVNDLSEARATMGGIRIVTLDGELVEASGAMIGGMLNKKRMKLGASLSSTIEKVATDLRNATEQSEKVAKRLRELKEELTGIEDMLKSTSMSDGGQDAKLQAAEVRKKEFTQKIVNKKAELDEKGKELSDSLDALDVTKSKLGEIESAIGELKGRRDALSERIHKAAPKDIAQQMKQTEQQLMELSSEMATLTSQRDTASKQIELMQERKREMESELESCKGQTQEHKSRISENRERTQKLETELVALRKMEESMGTEIEKLRGERDAIYREKTELEAAIDKHQSKMETNDDLVIGLRTKYGGAESALAELNAELSGYSVDISDREMPPIGELKEFINKCESELNSLGVVNLRAIEDYDEKKERHDSIKSEISQLSKQKSNLIKLVDELNDKKKIGLLKVYESIRANFKKIYTDLSNGGEADILLENPDSPLSGGLILRARPRNKKEMRLEALSGGEKSLTALSFIFSIQHYQPSPFYLLDEVDMFLDGVNAENVARAIAKNSANAQFIQVSLRKITLKEADHMIGVTLQPNGMSQLVMRPNIADELPENLEHPAAEEAG